MSMGFPPVVGGCRGKPCHRRRGAVDYPEGNRRPTGGCARVGAMSITMGHRPARPVGDLLRGWRERRRLSQLDLSIQAEISTRHLSFVETGRSTPSRDMV